MMRDVSSELADLTPDQKELLRLRLAEGGARPTRPDRLPLSFTQQQLWFLDRMAPGTAVYNVPCALWLRGPLDTVALGLALNAVVARQEALRIVFAEDDAGPHQRIQSTVDIPLPVVDLRHLPVADRAGAADQEAVEHGVVSFDLTEGPLVAARLVVLGDTEHLLLVTVHHIVYDAWSGDVFRTELVEFYRQFAGGGPANLPPLRDTFADHARRQREPAAKARMATQLAYWRDKLAGAPATSTPRPDRQRPPVQTHRGGRHVRLFPAELTTAMGAMAKESGVTLNAVALAGFFSVLRQVTGQDDLLVGMPAAGRSRVEWEPLIGSFANMLVLRMDLSGDPTVRELVRGTHHTVGEAYRHQDAPFARVVEEVAPPRDPGINPMFQVMFSVAEVATDECVAAGVEFSSAPVDNQLTDFDLFVTLARRAGECELVLDYNQDLYLAGTVERLAERVVAALGDMVRDADTTLRSLPSLRRDAIAVAATFTADLVAAPLRFLLDLHRTPASVDLVPYGQFVQHLLTVDDTGTTVGLVRWEDWLRRSTPDTEPGAVLDAAMRDFEAAVTAYRRRTAAPLVLVRCPSSPAAAARGWSGLFARLDDRLAQLRARTPDVHVDWAEEHPFPVAHDRATDDLGHIPYTQEYFAALAMLAVRRLPVGEPEPDRAAYLAEHLAEPAAVAARVALRAAATPRGTAPVVEPRTPTERRLAVVWREVLGVPDVGADSDFFALGGHSLLATQLLSRLRREFGREVSLYTLFTHPTLGQVAAALDDGGGPTVDVLRPAPPDAEPVASSVQQRLWAAGRIDGADAGNNTMFAAALHGVLDVPALARAVAEIVCRHEVLRTTFGEHRGLPIPVVHADLPAWCEPVDIAHTSGAQRDRLVAEHIERHAAHPYELAAGPLVRVQLLRAAADEHYLLIGMHHIVCDAASWQVFLDELSTLYDAYTAGLPSPLPPRPLQYGDYAHHQQNWLNGADIETDIAYWREKLRDAPAPAAIPGDRPRVGDGAGSAGRVTRLFPADAGRAVRALARAESVTPHSVLLAVFAVLLHRESGRSDLVIGMPTSGRDRPELADVIGCFADLLPLRLDVSGRPTFRRLVRRMHSTVTEGQAHQRLPFPRTLRLAPGSARHTLRCVLNYSDLPDEAPALPGLTVVPLPTGAAGADFDVLFTLDWQDNQVEADLTYSADVFSADRAGSLVARFGELLTELVAEPDGVVGADPVTDLEARTAEPDLPRQAVGLASSFPTGLVEPTLRFWSDLLGTPVLDVTAAIDGQVLRPLLDPEGPFRTDGCNVVLIRWEDWLTGEPGLAAGVAVLERVVADLGDAVTSYRARTDAELVFGVCPASPPLRGDRWAGVLDGLTDRLAAFAAEQPGVRVLRMDRWAGRYGVADPYPGRDGLPFSAGFETAVATTVARWVRRRFHPPVPAMVLDPGRFGAQAELVAVVRTQLRYGRDVVLTAPPSSPELAALAAIGAVRVGAAPDGALLLSPAVESRSNAVTVPAGDGLAAFTEHIWPLDEPAAGIAEPHPLPARVLADIATGLNTADRVAVAARSGVRRSTRRSSSAPRTDRERALAAIWADVLHLADIGIHDDFYDVGGDSLLAITVAFHAAEAGIPLSARQLTERRTIAELDLDAGASTVAPAAHEIVDGDVPLTPAQLWWFETVAPTMRNPAWFNHPYYVDVRRPIAGAHLAMAVRLLAAHHDSLRLRFRRDADGTLWQHHADPDDGVPFVSHDLAGRPAPAQDRAMESLAGAAQQALDLTDGPTCRVLHFATGAGRPDRLLIVAHHLVVDAISRDLLLGDLQTLCAQLERGEQPQLPAKSTSYGEWARQLSTQDMAVELPFWLAQTSGQDTSLPPDHPGAVTTLRAGAMTSTTLTAQDTAGLHEVTRRLRVNVRDLIVWGVTEVLAARNDSRACLLATTGHGRENLFADVDLNRTTGWFQVLYPVLVRLPDEDGDRDASVTTVAGQLARVPNNGIGYGMLRFSCPDPEVRRRLAALREPRIAINYMGSFGFDEVSQVEELFDVCPASYGDTDDGTGIWPYDLDIGGVIVGGRLRLDVGYGTDVYRGATAEAFLDDLRERLLSLLA